MNKKKTIDPEELKVLTLEGSKAVGKIFRIITDEIRSPEYNHKEQKGEINWNLTPTDEQVGQTSSLSFFDPEKVKKLIITDNVKKTTKKLDMSNINKAIDIVAEAIGLVNEIKKL